MLAGLGEALVDLQGAIDPRDTLAHTERER